MKRLISTIKKYTTRKLVLLLFFIVIISNVALIYSNHIFSNITGILPGVLDAQLFYFLDVATQFFTTISPAGVRYYLHTIATIDAIYPLIYTTALAMLIAYILHKKHIKNSKLDYIILLPLILMIFDYTENILTIILLRALPTMYPNVVYVLTVISSMKWSATIIVLLFILMLLTIKKRNEENRDTSKFFLKDVF